MRIAITADPELPVPPLLYGGIERVVDLLAREYSARGHQVTLFAHQASSCPVPLRGWPGRSSRSPVDTLRNMAELTRGVLAGGFDVVHSCSRLAYLLPILALPIPKIMNYQRPASLRTTTLMHRLARGTLEFSAVGRWMTEKPGLPGRWHSVPNCVPLGSYSATNQVPDDSPLVFLGRMEEIKGPHIAIDVARRCGRNLVLAGNLEPAHENWFAQHVRPHLDGKQIRFIGPVDDAQKNTLLGGAHAFLMPILWDEPFGIVMAEAMACGTPVIAFRRGAAAEVVVHGETGFVVDSVEEMAECVGKITDIDRADCRRRVEQQFSPAAVARQYLGIYEDMQSRCNALGSWLPRRS